MENLEAWPNQTAFVVLSSRLRLVTFRQVRLVLVVSVCSFVCILMIYILAGCGCEESTVDEIVEELKARQRGRGDTAQIQRTEQINVRLSEMDQKLNVIMQHLNIPQQSLEMTDRA